MSDLAKQLEAALVAGVTDEALAIVRKKVEDVTATIDDYLTYSIKEELSHGLSRYAVDMAQRAIESLLSGNEEQMRRYLTCQHGGYTGRDRGHSVINGTLFETGGIALRRSLVDAHRDLISSERILDLESQVKSLVENVNKLESTNRALQEKLRDYRVEA